MRPESSADQSKEKLDEVLQSVLMETWNTRRKAKENEANNETSKEEETIGSVGWWEGPLGERYVAVVLDKDTLQLYYATRRGFAPKEMPVNIDEWRPSEEMKDSYYVLVGNQVYIRF